MNKLYKISELKNICDIWKKNNQKIVWTNGCFDILHVGHIRSFNYAKKYGNKLIVGLNSDLSVKRLKGETRPFFNELYRAEMLSSIEYIDGIIIFNDDTPIDTINILKPDICCKGEDYKPPFGKLMPEKEIVESYGGKIVFIPLIHGISTTILSEKLN